MNRKITPKVKNGIVQKKNNDTKSTGAYYHNEDELQIFKYKALKDYKHVVSISDIKKFIQIIPNFQTYAKGLKSIILDGKYCSPMGLSEIGVISLMAWKKADLELATDKLWINEHCQIFNVLEIDFCLESEIVNFTKLQARDFMLLHVFIHELGHHYDRYCTKSNYQCPRGEDYAENFANDMLSDLWGSYQEIFY